MNFQEGEVLAGSLVVDDEQWSVNFTFIKTGCCDKSKASSHFNRVAT